MPESNLELALAFAVILACCLFATTLLTLFRSRQQKPQEQEVELRSEEIRKLNETNSRNLATIAEYEANLKNKNTRIIELDKELASKKNDSEQLSVEIVELKEKIARHLQKEENYELRLKDLREAKDEMKKEFSVVANKLLANHGDTFKKQSKDQLESMLSPFKEQIEKFEKDFVQSARESRDQHVALAEKIKSLSELSAATSKETRDLTRALKGNVQIQGAWGEMILETILQKSGLREGEEYSRQETHSADDGSRPRTDFIVKLPNGESIIIDSKVSLHDYEAYAASEDEAERATRLSALAKSIRTHIKTLSSKEYHSKVGSELDFVIMFLAIEPAWNAALQSDQELIHFAADNQIAITTPTTLTTALKTIAAIWRVERQNKNAEEIAVRAGKIYDKFVGYISDMSEIGNRIEQASRAHDNAMKKLSNGRGNLVGQMQTLKEMGAKANKAIPEKLLEVEDSKNMPKPEILIEADRVVDLEAK